MKSADFEALSPEVQQIYREHDKLHTLEEQRQQAMQQGQAAAMAGMGVPNPEQLVGMPGKAQMNGGNPQGVNGQPQPPAQPVGPMAEPQVGPQ